MVQQLTNALAFLMGKQQHFRIKFRQYDDAKHVFFPHYNPVSPPCNGDIVAFVWGDTIKFGVSLSDAVGALELQLLSRKTPLSGTRVFIPAGRLIAIFLPE